MGKTRRFNPVDWFVSTCFAILAGALALVVAIHLVRAVWIWLVLLVGLTVLAAGLVAGLVRLLAWRRGQSW